MIASNVTASQPALDSPQLFLSALWITLSCKLVRTKVKPVNILSRTLVIRIVWYRSAESIIFNY